MAVDQKTRLWIWFPYENCEETMAVDLVYENLALFCVNYSSKNILVCLQPARHSGVPDKAKYWFDHLMRCRETMEDDRSLTLSYTHLNPRGDMWGGSVAQSEKHRSFLY